jgi:hypothetical protein
MAIGLLLALVALLPLGPVTGQPLAMPDACGDAAFSTEEDFVTQGPTPPDGDTRISDGDLLSTNHVICARNDDLVGPFDVSADLGLDAADVVDVESAVVAFSTELDSPNTGQFTAGDLLAAGGVVIPNVALTHRFQYCVVEDASQPEVDYGFWFEDDVVRWQEFVPSLDNVGAVELFVAKVGSPGNILVEIQETDGTVLGDSIILEAEAPTLSGWATAEFSPPVPVVTGSKHRITVYSDEDSPSPADRYSWRGETTSTYCPSCDTDVSNDWPAYRYAFKTRGVEQCLPSTAPPTAGPPGYDLGLDALHFVGDPRAILAFLGEVGGGEMSRDDWLKDPSALGEWLAQYGIDIWFSTEGTWSPPDALGFLDGDLLSALDGAIVAENRALLPSAAPADVRDDGVDFGLDAATGSRAGSKGLIQFSTEILCEDSVSFTDGDVLNHGDGIAYTNQGLVQAFEPKADFLGLDAFHADIVEGPKPNLFLPVVLKRMGQTSR